SEKTLAEWSNIFSDAEACVTPVLTLEEMTQNPQVLARNMIQSIQHDPSGAKIIGNPIKVSKTPAQVTHPAPKLGEHTNEFIKTKHNETFSNRLCHTYFKVL